MLASSVTDLSKLRYPLLASPKYDGIRGSVQNGVVLSRNLKPIPNWRMQDLWGRKHYEGMDGEFVDGDPTAQGCFSRTSSVVMSEDKEIEELNWYVFDSYHPRNPFVIRNRSEFTSGVWVTRVEHLEIADAQQLDWYIQTLLAQGWEGVMLRDPQGRYKQGRSTEREGGLLRIKPFEDAEAFVFDTYEQMENTNAQKTNELGRQKRSSHKAGKVGKGTLGGFTVHPILKDGAPACNWLSSKPCEHMFNIGTGVGLTDAARLLLWAVRETLPGKIVKYRYQKVGTKDAPRQPIWLGFRDERDM